MQDPQNLRRNGKGSLTRWSLNLHDYHRIRQLILNKSAIMQSTNLQLVEANQTILVQWHNKRVRRKDLTLLLQVINLSDPLPVAAEPVQFVNMLIPLAQHFCHAPHPNPMFTVFVIPGSSATISPQPSSTSPSAMLSSAPPASALQPHVPQQPHTYTKSGCQYL